ncbi:hypothetical protein jhhlp_005193 [Lomentospora prolificans]|uniref:DUF7721 domain-containing protein n=1 Tax=Lomentospora prolificans TaxID=41688 RepID=A0A2N3N728_9PEZI|nr:hypothetical protein jhhlp_005193 [Lomentospora prolificans]
MDKLIGALTQDKDDNNKGPGGALGPLAGNLLDLLDNDDDKDRAAEDASRRAGDSGSSELFRGILSSLSSDKNKVANQDIDEEGEAMRRIETNEGYAINKHQKYFGENDDHDQADSRGLGSAAAMQALKLFTSGQDGPKTSSSTKSESAFLALAMSEASKLFDQKASQGKVAPDTSKESAIQQAGEMALKMYLKSQVQGGGSSGGSGGAGDLLGMASKFLK